VAVGIQQILVEGDTITVHHALQFFRYDIALSSRVQVDKPFAIAQHDLTGAGEHQDALFVEL
jgi:hypothetical protein